MIIDSTRVHPDDLELFEQHAEIAIAAAIAFELPLQVFEHKRRPNADAALGLCYVSEGRISVVYRFKYEGHWARRRELDDRAILNTVAHELAHLRHERHGEAHRALTSELLAWMEAQ